MPLATLPGMRERTLTLSSAGKSYSFTGWKVGWATGPRELVGAVLAAKQWLTFTSGSPLQPAVAHALDHEPDFPAALAASLQQRRDLLVAGLADAGLTARVPEGTYFATTDISHLGWADGREFCLALPDVAGVVAIPAPGRSTTTRGGPAPGAVGVLQGGRRDQRGRTPPRRRRPVPALSVPGPRLRQAVRALLLDDDDHVLLVHFDWEGLESRAGSGPVREAASIRARVPRTRCVASWPRSSASRTPTSAAPCGASRGSSRCSTGTARPTSPTSCGPPGSSRGPVWTWSPKASTRSGGSPRTSSPLGSVTFSPRDLGAQLAIVRAEGIPSRVREIVAL